MTVYLLPSRGDVNESGGWDETEAPEVGQVVLTVETAECKRVQSVYAESRALKKEEDVFTLERRVFTLETGVFRLDTGVFTLEKGKPRF